MMWWSSNQRTVYSSDIVLRENVGGHTLSTSSHMAVGGSNNPCHVNMGRIKKWRKSGHIGCITLAVFGAVQRSRAPGKLALTFKWFDWYTTLAVEGVLVASKRGTNPVVFQKQGIANTMVAVWEFPNTLEHRRKSNVVSECAEWVYNPCHPLGLQRFTKGGARKNWATSRWIGHKPSHPWGFGSLTTQPKKNQN